MKITTAVLTICTLWLAAAAAAAAGDCTDSVGCAHSGEAATAVALGGRKLLGGGEGKRSFGGNRDGERHGMHGKDGNDGPEGKRSFGAHGIGKRDKEGDNNPYANRKFYRERNNPIRVGKDGIDGPAWKADKAEKGRPSKGRGGVTVTDPGVGIIIGRGVEKDGTEKVFVRRTGDAEDNND